MCAVCAVSAVCERYWMGGVRRTRCAYLLSGALRKWYLRYYLTRENYYGNTTAILRQYYGNTTAILRQYYGNTIVSEQ